MPFRRKPLMLPAPPEMPEKPQKINWLQTLLPPFIMLVVLGIVASIIQTQGFIVYTMALMGIYPISRVIAYYVQKGIYDKKEAERAAQYVSDLETADREIATYIRKQRELLKGEFLPTADVIKLAQAQGEIHKVWYRTKRATDFLHLRLGLYEGKPSFLIQTPKGDEIDAKDTLLLKARQLQRKYQVLDHIPYLLPMKALGSVAILGEDRLRYGLARRLLLDVVVHHRPDEVEVYVLSSHPKAAELWEWLKWTPHSKVFDENKDFDHLVFGSQSIKIFLGRFENYITKDNREKHRVIIIDVNGVQQYDDGFIETLLSNTTELNVSLLFVGGNEVPRSVRGVLKFKDGLNSIFVDTRIDVKDKDEKEYRTLIELDELPTLEMCEHVSRSLAGIKLLSSAGDTLLSPNVNLFRVLGIPKEEKVTSWSVINNWAENEKVIKSLKNKELLQFPIGLIEQNSRLISFSLNLLESRFGGTDAYHTMLIGTTGSGKSEFIKSLILGAAYKYPPQYLNFFCMDFKGGSTIEQLEKLPHVIGAMTNLDEVSAQRGLIAIRYEIDRRQSEFQETAKLQKREIKDIWDFNKGRSLEARMPHLVLVLDEFTRGLDMLNVPDFDLQELLEKRLVPQGRSLGIYLLLANQVVNAKVMKLLPNIGWKIAMRVTTADQLQFIDSGLKPPTDRGRGYIQSIGQDPIEFQSGFSGNYVQYADAQIKPKNVPIIELLANGTTRELNQAVSSNKENDELAEFKEGSQIISSVVAAQNQLEIPAVQKIYLPPLPATITLDELGFGKHRYRQFTNLGWQRKKDNRNFLRTSIGMVDLVYKCARENLTLDFLETNSNLLIVGAQQDIIASLHSILFSLLLSHSPDDVQVYMLEFGKGLRTLPPYPHIGSCIDEDETERIARTVNFFETEFLRREKLSRSNKEATDDAMPHLFLLINNIAGLVDNINLYKKIFRLITQESSKYGIHLVLTALPRGTSTRVSSSDLKAIKSRIVFPSINHEDYWHYLDTTERKLIKLTEINDQADDSYKKAVSRAYWLFVADTANNEPVELQIAIPTFDGKSDVDFVAMMNQASGYAIPGKIRVLEKKYLLNEFPDVAVEKYALPIGIKWLDLKPLCLQFDSLPSIWGVSGPREAGKTNFLTLLSERWSQCGNGTTEVFAMFPNQLTEYCQKQKRPIAIGREQIFDRLKVLGENDFEKLPKGTLLIFDDLNFVWESNPETNKEMKALLGKLANKLYSNRAAMFVGSFNYAAPFKVAKSNDAIVREIHDNKTGLCLGYEGDWIIGSADLANYRKNLNDGLPPGRGVFVLKGKEFEVQTYFYKGE